MKLALVLLVVWALAAKDYLFKDCTQSGFCARNRHYAAQVHQSGGAIGYYIDAASVRVTPHAVVGNVVKPIPLGLVELPFELHLLGNAVRFAIDEDRSKVAVAGLNTTRYAAIDVFGPLRKSVRDAVVAEKVTLPFGEYTAVLAFDPIELRIEKDGKPQVSFNLQNLLNVEHYRKQEDNAHHLSEMESDFDMFRDSFGDSQNDKMPLGPEAVAADITFHNFQHVYGIPEHADSLSLKDTAGNWPYRLFNVDIFEYDTDSKMPMYGSIPLMTAVKPDVSVGVFWANAADTFVDIHRGDSVQTHWMLENGVLDVVFFVAPRPEGVSRAYGELAGFAALPPLFSLGYHQCRWNYNDMDDVLEVSAKMDEHHLPYDTIWLDIEYANQKRYFTWNPDTFGDPQRMLQALDHTGRNLVVIIDPHLKTGYPVSDHVASHNIGIRDAANTTYKGHCWPGESVWIDSMNPSSQAYWDGLFGDFLGPATNIHLWNDMNEPSVFNGPETSAPKDLRHYGDYEHRSVHNVWGKTFHELTYNSLIKRQQHTLRQRPFILTRSYYAGSQRTAAMWTGDNMAKWEYLKMSIPMVLTSNVVGMPFAGADIGGFFGDPSHELLTRWYQAGIWYPFMRAHAHIDSRRREPYIPGEPYTLVIRLALELRYELLPVWYTAFWAASERGLPVVQPMFFVHPENMATYGIDDQFYVGGLLVKPVTQEAAQKVLIYIPDGGLYYDYFNGRYQGEVVRLAAPGYVEKAVLLGDVPILLRGGSVIFKKTHRRRSTKLMKRDPYQITVALDALGNAFGQVYSDDGESFAYERGDYGVASVGVSGFEIRGEVQVGGAHEMGLVSELLVLGQESTIVSVEMEQRGVRRSVRFSQENDQVWIKARIDLHVPWQIRMVPHEHDEL